MATTKDFLNYFSECTDAVGGVSVRAMMGEYALYYNSKVVGVICNNRVLVKDVPAARSLMPDARLELPYDGAKLMLYLEDFENAGFVKRLFGDLYACLPEPKKKAKK